MGGGGVLGSLDPTGGNFLGLGSTVGRGVGDVVTGGLGEFGRPDSFGLPPSLATAGKIGAGTVLGGMAGGPGGAMMGGTLGGLLGGNPLGGAVGGGIGGLLQSLISGGGTGGMPGMGIDPGRLALGGSLLGLGLSQNTGVPNIQLPSNAADQQAIQSEEQRLKGMQGQSQTDLMNMLSTGPQGEAFREKYNNLGLLDSGAFNAGLAGQFADQNYQQNQQLQNLDVSGLSRQFGLEDLGTQANLATTLANAQQKADLQKTLLGLSGQVFGGGMGGGGMGGGGGSAGGGGGGLFGGIGSALSGLGSGVSNLISNMMGGGGSTPIDAGTLVPGQMDPTQMSMIPDPTQMMSMAPPFPGTPYPGGGYLPTQLAGGFLQPL